LDLKIAYFLLLEDSSSMPTVATAPGPPPHRSMPPLPVFQRASNKHAAAGGRPISRRLPPAWQPQVVLLYPHLSTSSYAKAFTERENSR